MDAGRYKKQYKHIAEKDDTFYNVYMELKERILKLRTEQGLSQRQLAEKLGTTRYRISELENGHRQPSLKEMRAYSTLFSVPLEYFSPSFHEDVSIPNMADKKLLKTFMTLQELKEEFPDLYQTISLLAEEPKGKAVTSLLFRYLNGEELEERILIEGFKLLKDHSRDYTYNEALRYIWNQAEEKGQ